MKPFEIECKKIEVVTITTEAEDRYAAAQRAKPIAQLGFAIMAVGDDPVIAWCESCGKAVFEGDKYEICTDGIYLCKVCAQMTAIQEAQQRKS